MADQANQPTTPSKMPPNAPIGPGGTAPLPGTGNPPTPAVQPRPPIHTLPPETWTPELGNTVMFNSGAEQFPAIVTRVNHADRTYDVTVFAPESDPRHRRTKVGVLSGHISKEPRYKERPQLPKQPGEIPTNKK